MIRLENILKAFLQNVLKMSWRRLEDVLKMSWRPLQNVLATSRKCHKDVFARRLQGKTKTNILVLIKASWRRMSKENIFVLMKTSSEDEDERRLEDVFIMTNACWALGSHKKHLWVIYEDWSKMTHSGPAWQANTRGYLGPCQTSMMELF